MQTQPRYITVAVKKNVGGTCFGLTAVLDTVERKCVGTFFSDEAAERKADILNRAI